MVYLVAMQGLGKPGVNIGNLREGKPADSSFYFPSYADGSTSRDLENMGAPKSIYEAKAEDSPGADKLIEPQFGKSGYSSPDPRGCVCSINTVAWPPRRWTTILIG